MRERLLSLPENVLGSMEYAKAVCEMAGIPLKMTTVHESLYPALKDKIPDLFPLHLQRKIQ